ncbi:MULTISPECIES: TrkA family potassium uptake protein [unclassified Butyrivibrio]|uniref:potassium channel family protein n=1 Tax=unclassified Butyrivibrio TaxID=2639466 RepID=UPI0003B32356|nr:MULTISPECIES: TrkA family potassium uptake protein [unclassified Butyrivibrio]SDB08412.1 trk system potassium uptake protein TrkA [Butyrivibrio sp. INlla16]
MKSILIIGVGNFGMLIAKQVHELGHQVMAIDKDEERINEVLPYVTNALIGDSTNENFLRSIGINNFDVCIETIGNDFQSSLETTSLLKELGGKKVVSRANREVQAKFLLRNGADEVVNPEKEIAKWTAIRYTSNHILDYVKLDDNHAIFEVKLPRDWIGKSIKEINIRQKFGINIMAIKENGDMNLTISPDDVIKEGQTLLVLGEHKAIQRCFHI